VIRITPPGEDFTAPERYGLDTLLDLSGVLRVEDSSASVVTLVFTPELCPLDAVAGGRVVPERGDGEVRLPRAVLSHVLGIAGAGAEQATRAADRHDRVPAGENPVVRAGAERRPVLSELGRALREGVRAVAGRRPVRCLMPWPGGRRWAAALSHDVDVVSGWPAFTVLRLLELTRAGEIRRAGRVLGAAAGALGGSPVWQGVSEVLRMEAERGVHSTWFFLCGTPTLGRWRAGDVTYAIEGRPARRLIAAVRDAGHELGVHGTFATTVEGGAFGQERARLAAVTGLPVAPGIRQHFLKMRPGVTQRRMRRSGFTYDATYGFSDRNGFRLGVADVVAGWDAEAGALSGLDEVPLHWMDRAQSKYQGIEDPRVWVADALELAGRCRDVGGLWVGLWHPNLTDALGFPGAPAAYEELLSRIVGAGDPPAVDTLERFVSWRRRRRAARANRVGPDGAVEWIGAPVPLEDGAGRAVA